MVLVLRRRLLLVFRMLLWRVLLPLMMELVLHGLLRRRYLRLQSRQRVEIGEGLVMLLLSMLGLLRLVRVMVMVAGIRRVEQ